MPQFIGKAALQHIADNFSSQIIMGAAHFRPEELDRMGLAEGLVRISVGAEDSCDLIEDLLQALAAMGD